MSTLSGSRHFPRATPAPNGGGRPHWAVRHRGARRHALLGKAVAALVLTGGSGLLLAPGAAAGVSTLYVDGATGHDQGACSTQSAQCATIAYALTQAAPGATVYVARGTYAEQLSITRDVTIIGRSPGNTILAPAAVVQNDVGTDSATPQFAIIDIHGASGDLGAVNLENLTIDGRAAGASSFNGCADNFPGVYFHDAGGLLRNDTITDVEMPPNLFGCQTGKGVGALVATDAGHLSDVTMARVTVKGFQKNGLECLDPGTTCTIENSVVTGAGPTSLTAQNGVEIWGVSSLDFMHNKVTGDTYTGPSGPAQATGLLLLNAGTVTVRANKLSANDVDVYAGEVASFPPVAPAGTWTIRGNRLSNATDEAPPPWNVEGAGYGDGLAVDSTTNPVQVVGNRTGTDFEYGIALYGASGVTVRNNGAHRDYDGIYVGGPGSVGAASTHDTLKGNRAFYDGNDGILADVTAADSGNSFISNSMHHNATFEAQDRSSGFGTAGTANSWVHDHCANPHAVSPAAVC